MPDSTRKNSSQFDQVVVIKNWVSTILYTGRLLLFIWNYSKDQVTIFFFTQCWLLSMTLALGSHKMLTCCVCMVWFLIAHRASSFTTNTTFSKASCTRTLRFIFQVKSSPWYFPGWFLIPWYLGYLCGTRNQVRCQKILTQLSPCTTHDFRTKRDHLPHMSFIYNLIS